MNTPKVSSGGNDQCWSIVTLRNDVRTAMRKVTLTFILFFGFNRREYLLYCVNELIKNLHSEDINVEDGKFENV